NLVNPLQLRDSPLRNQQGILSYIGLRAYAGILTWAQNTRGIRKLSTDLNRTGARVYFSIHKKRVTPLWVNTAVTQNQLQVCSAFGFVASETPVVLLCDTEI